MKKNYYYELLLWIITMKKKNYYYELVLWKSKIITMNYYYEEESVLNVAEAHMALYH